MINSLSVLETEFCPPLDPALVYAIYHDFERSDTEKLQQARKILEPIKESALVEQGLEFDPSGSSIAKDRSILSSENGGASTGSDVLRSDRSEITAISRGLSSLEFGENPRSTSSSSTDGTPEFENGGFLDDIEALDRATKEARLMETFPTLKTSAITLTLRKCNDSFARATDELLNQVYFEGAEGEEKILSRSIDAFFTDDAYVPGRKKKGKKARRSKALYGSSTDGSLSPEEPPANKWESGSDAAGFLSSRMNIPTSTVSSVYHKSGASVPRTIQALLDDDIKLHEEEYESDTTHVTHALELHAEFPSIDPAYALALIRTAHPSTAAAHQLAKAFTHKATSRSRSASSIQIIPRYAPIPVSDSEPLSPSSSSSRTTASTASLHAARASAFTQASAAYRRGKSDPLMRAAAGYYGQVGRAHDAAYKAAAAADADALVAAQSSPTQLDLHGVGVRDATRLTRDRVSAWWHGLGDARFGRGERPGVGSGFRVITGKGTHSEGRLGKLGPAVGRMLVREGWRVEVGSGVLVVTGVAKRK